MNENGHDRGLHIVVINPYAGHVEIAKVFDTYKSDEGLVEFMKTSHIPNGFIVATACKDECTVGMRFPTRQWFINMGSEEMWNVQWR